MSKLYHFHGGVHPPANKTQSTQTPIAQAAMPPRLVIPLHQHAGGTATRPAVKVGDRVLKGQVIGLPEGRISSAVHASTSGTVTAIDLQPVAHPSGLPALCVTLIPDGKDEWIEHHGTDYRELPHADLRHLLRMAGIVGLGGAVFPSDLKLHSGQQRIKTLVLNGAECEPYITCDDMLMRERAAEIVRGAEIMCALLQAEVVLVGIEDNKPQAIATMQQAVATGQHENIRVVAVPTIYPGGGAKQLIRVLTGIEVPYGVRASEMGVQCFNVGTAYSVCRAIAHGEPLLSRIVTITGNVQRPQNFEVLLGTPIAELAAQAGTKPDTTGYIMGGPMMGVPVPSAQAGVIKATNCLIASSPALFPPAPPALPCIRCTRCAEVCPADLQPQELYWFAKARELGKAQEYHLFDCIECGACSYVCPSHIPLVQYYRFAKSEIWAHEQEKNAADLARERHEFRQERLERDKRERAEKLAQKERAAAAAKAAAAAAPPAPAGDSAPPAAPAQPAADPAQALIQAAIERAKAQAALSKPKNTENLTPQQRAEIAEIEARRAKIREIARPDNGQNEGP
ncbi:MAG: electron transport complex subunit RsxC [Sideroxydans sp.]|nr:electron transport complex subunit RsxC [Sideroxydans sp.]